MSEPMPGDKTFQRALRRAALWPVVGLGVFVLLLLGMIGYLVDTMGWVNHTNGVIAGALDVEKKLLDVQTATRGYMLTFDESMLAPFDASRPGLPGSLENLKKLVADDPAQVQRVVLMQQRANEWLERVDKALSAAKQAHVTPSPTQVRSGGMMFEPIRREMREFLEAEYAVRDTSTAKAIHIAIFTVGAALAAATMFGVLQTLATRRGLRDVTGRFRDAVDLAERRNAQVKQVVMELDVELKAVAEIQRSLLPLKLPNIPTLQLAASYQTSRRAGGDYYDFFRLPESEDAPPEKIKWGILIADVSGHGTPAAVLMAVTHAIAHGVEGPLDAPGKLLYFVNQRLCAGYTTGNSAFVTAFFGIYDPVTRTLEYSSAGHNPPRLLRTADAQFVTLEDAQSMPLGVDATEVFASAAVRLDIGDTLVLYTDGWTEARPAGTSDLFGVRRLDDIFLSRRDGQPADLIVHAQHCLDTYVDHQPPQDDRTLLLLRASAAGHDDGPHHVTFMADQPTLMESVEAAMILSD